MYINGKVRANAVSSKHSFFKQNPAVPAFQKTGNFTLTTTSDIVLENADKYFTIPSGTAVLMPGSSVSGTDYVIWVTTAGLLSVNDSYTPPETGARKIGGFHFAPGSNASGQAGGNTTPQINEYSIWDLKFRPRFCDPRGMTLVAGLVWFDIYLTGVNAISVGSSKYNVTIADGSNPPKIPTKYGGDGSANYGTYMWFEAAELASSLGKRLPSNREFLAAAFGTTEGSSLGVDPVSTILNEAYTSKWGLIQSTGCMRIFGQERGGSYAAAAWHANTEGRGSQYNEAYAAHLGGAYNDTTYSGSRCSIWEVETVTSNAAYGSRFVCDHVQSL